MSHKCLALCSLTMVFSAPLGCFQESLEPYIVEVDQNDQLLPVRVEIGQMFAGKRLVKAKLKGANFSGSMMAGIDLREADLEDADLTGAMLLGANLSRANLVNANFEGAMLLGAQLENAHISGANFRNTAFLTQDQIDDACGTPKVLSEGLKAPKVTSCDRTTMESK